MAWQQQRPEYVAIIPTEYRQVKCLKLIELRDEYLLTPSIHGRSCCSLQFVQPMKASC
ncbi:MAG: hypothetical protein ACI9VI_003292 [Candidatus Azotimanducaceae bacterium]|jgi:hypothetical protein